MATKSDHSRPRTLTAASGRGPGGLGRCVGERQHTLAGTGLLQTHALATGLTEMGVMHEPVDGGAGEALGHDLVEAGGVEVAADGEAALLVGGVDEAVEAFGGVGGYGEQPDVINDDQLRSQDPL